MHIDRYQLSEVLFTDCVGGFGDSIARSELCHTASCPIRNVIARYSTLYQDLLLYVKCN